MTAHNNLNSADGSGLGLGVFGVPAIFREIEPVEKVFLFVA